MKRESGILMHISSLHSEYGIGSLGKAAFEFIDYLKNANQKLWQILPLGLVGYGESPYSSFSAFAGNPLFIDLDSLSEKGLLTKEDLTSEIEFQYNEVNYEQVKKFKNPLLIRAALNFITKNNWEYFDRFEQENSYWLNDFALFYAIKNKLKQVPLFEFPEEIIIREKNTIIKLREELKQEILIQKVIQYFFFQQWEEVKKYANANSIKIIGDIPLYVASDSADVWANHKLFMLDENRKQTLQAGVPPDYFSETGQLWGNPVYDWKAAKADKFNWWEARLRMNFKMFDIVRIDHFRGLSEFWAVKSGQETAFEGEWLPALGHEMLSTLTNRIGKMNLIAEDLGVITDDVEKLRDDFKLPGMKILQFAYDSNEGNPFLPHNYLRNCVVYTGTHDNDTTRGWFESCSEQKKEYLRRYSSRKLSNIGRAMIKQAWASVADISIAPLQDLFDLDTNSRMNIPGTTEGNWKWRCKKEDINEESHQYLREISLMYGRNC